MTVALIDITNLKVEFHADAAQAQKIAEQRDLLYVGKPEDLGDGLTGGQMVALYNATAAELNTGLNPVNRFATKEAAVKRLMANITDLWELRRETAKAKAKSVPAAKITANANAAAKKVREAKASTGPRKELWRRVKEEKVSKVAYRPKEGSVQDGLYKLLTKLEPMTMEAYCEGAKQLKTRDATLFTPAQVWGALRYLFVTKRGYGLKFDGTRIWLVVPADERAARQRRPVRGADESR